MATNQKFSGFQVNRSMLITGSALTGLGALIGLTGTMIVGVALASAGREWVHHMDTPPTELAARTMHQAKVASMAGLEAWRSQGNGSSG
ncbi:hypothetical protein GCM10010193_31320 [Kitasatospora atroaurantiaca]|uniref:Uncharacterized protein n=1 Tax=Kitasatospora atroaurantiaca TaxID=285545 RepID=A0A561ER79_9ACTN|nr:hypothetical protein [Kitasatospora atroaurantiaca]TWE18118.1 hypothetical protein FB465_3167 [Kitasatospora atroaurantiaca]